MRVGLRGGSEVGSIFSLGFFGSGFGSGSWVVVNDFGGRGGIEGEGGGSWMRCRGGRGALEGGAAVCMVVRGGLGGAWEYGGRWLVGGVLPLVGGS